MQIVAEEVKHKIVRKNNTNTAYECDGLPMVSPTALS